MNSTETNVVIGVASVCTVILSVVHIKQVLLLTISGRVIALLLHKVKQITEDGEVRWRGEARRWRGEVR